MQWKTAALWLAMCISTAVLADEATEDANSLNAELDMKLGKSPDAVRFATYNVSLNRRNSGDLARDLNDPSNLQARRIAEILQIVRPDVVLLNEFDFDSQQTAAKRFVTNFLQVAQNGHEPLNYAEVYAAPVNTGVDSEFDLDNNGKLGEAADAFGFGYYPGQYGMLVLSRYPIDRDAIRTMRKFLWKDMPNAKLPTSPDDGAAYYSQDEIDAFRLSSKSHWDVPIIIRKTTVHLLAAHPTPPVFDGPEDRNGTRNHDEIRLLADYVSPDRSSYIYDDNGKQGGLRKDALFVIAGDLNADPFGGDSTDSAIRQLTEHPLINNSVVPESAGGTEQSKKQGGVNLRHKGDPKHDTADFSDRGRGTGNLRIDYVLPPKNLHIVNAGVFWPTESDERFELIKASDHRLVWIDVKVK
ncbi:MAG: endonuclease/exonuclease/phosphatase family protein [Planctomycetales bacterium]|nr:endonuclease/exonuclease/phosphatase family protein [Planctomycetales bacterium]